MTYVRLRIHSIRVNGERQQTIVAEWLALLLLMKNLYTPYAGDLVFTIPLKTSGALSLTGSKLRRLRKIRRQPFNAPALANARR